MKCKLIGYVPGACSENVEDIQLLSNAWRYLSYEYVQIVQCTCSNLIFNLSSFFEYWGKGIFNYFARLSRIVICRNLEIRNAIGGLLDSLENGFKGGTFRISRDCEIL